MRNPLAFTLPIGVALLATTTLIHAGSHVSSQGGLMTERQKTVLGQMTDFFSRVKLSGYMSQGFQSIEADSGAFDPRDADTDSGFNRFRYAIDFTVDLADNVDAFVELSEEPNDFGNDFTPHVDLALVNFHLNDALTFQIGTIVTILFNDRGFSDGAVVQGNPLIGNSPADMVTAAEGAKLIGEFGKFRWDVGIATSDFGESFNADRGYNYLFRGSYHVTENAGIGFGAASSDHGDQVRNGNQSPIRAGMYTGDGDNYRFPSIDRDQKFDGIRNTHAGLIPGLDADAIHFDAWYKSDLVILRGWIGAVEDDFSFGDANGLQTVATQNVSFIERESKIKFFGVEGTYYVVPQKFYVAGRYVSVTNDSDGAGSDDELNRAQIGVGYWYKKNILFKAEYVTQEEGRDSPGQIGDDWDGFSLETSFSF